MTDCLPLDLQVENMIGPSLPFDFLTKIRKHAITAKAKNVTACGIITVVPTKCGNKSLKSGNHLIRLAGMFPLEHIFLVPHSLASPNDCNTLKNVTN